MKYLILMFLLAISGLPAETPQQTFIGIVTDSECAKADHSRMQMGPTDADCTIACIDFHGALYVLYDGKDSYTLSDQMTPKKFAAQKVKVVGTLDEKIKTIRVNSIVATK